MGANRWAGHVRPKTALLDSERRAAARNREGGATGTACIDLHGVCPDPKSANRARRPDRLEARHRGSRRIDTHPGDATGLKVYRFHAYLNVDRNSRAVRDREVFREGRAGGCDREDNGQHDETA